MCSTKGAPRAPGVCRSPLWGMLVFWGVSEGGAKTVPTFSLRRALERITVDP